MENPKTGQLYKKVDKFTMRAVKASETTTQKQTVSMRELIKIKRVGKTMEENNFAPVTDRDGT